MNLKNLKNLAAAAAAAAGLACAAVADVMPGTQDEGLFPFTFTTPAHHTVVDCSDWFAAPAGADGFVRAEGERFVTDRGEVFLNGVNLTGAACFPTHEEAEELAKRLGRLGFNAVRLHYADCVGLTNIRFRAQVGLIDPNGKTGMEIRPDTLDRYDYLVYALEKNGIYVDINLRVGLTLDHRLGFPDGPSLNRGVCAIDPRLVEFEKQYARTLLTHVNPYTQRAYVDDPGVAIVEIRNESALPTHWANGLLDDLAEPWRSQFRGKWNEFRRSEGATDEIDVLAANRQGPAWPESVTNQFVRFLFDLDTKYWRTMSSFLKDELKVKCVVVGTSLGYSTPYMHLGRCRLDAADEHLYWSHPEIGGKDMKWKCVQTAEVNFPEDAVFKATVRVAGRPFIMTETSEPFPSLYSSEHFPLVHAYGAFQGWAGIFAYTWNHSTNAAPDCAEYFFSHSGRADTQAHFPACAAISRGRAVREASRRVTVPAPEHEYVDRMARRRRMILLANEALGTDKMPLWNENLRHGVAVDLTGTAPEPAVEPVPSDNVWRSDTGELVWDSSRKRESFVTCDTRSVKFFTGFAKGGKKVQFRDATLEIGPTRLGFATVTMCARGGGGFGADGRPSRILVAATGLVKNSGETLTLVPGNKSAWHDPDGVWTTLHEDGWGRGPQLCEGVPATLTLNVPAPRVRCWALDGAALRKAAVPVSSDARGRARIAFGPEYRTLWYEISVVEAARNPDADWMVGKLGVFLHWWPTPENPDAAKDFDVAGLVRDLKEIGPDFFFFTLGQNSGYYNAPNAPYERYGGFGPGECCGRVRDLPAEIAAALRGSGIRFGLYAPCQPSFDEPATEARFGNLARAEDRNYYMTQQGIDRWAEVLGAWSARYGQDVSIWWLDGAERYLGMTDAKAEKLAAAVRAGNPHAVVSFNSGLLDGATQVVNTASCDYTAGEVTRGPSVRCGSRTVGGAQWFALTHLGSYWKRSDFNLPDRSVWWWLKDVVTAGGAAAFDVGRDERTGRLDSEQKRRLRRIFDCARSLRDEVDGADAFRLADADVVVNRSTAKTKRGADWYKCAISDLTNKMAQASGRVPVVYDEGLEPGDAKALVYLGETAAAKSAGISGEGLRNGDWRLRTDPGRAYLFGKTGMAASYAMTEFVESCLGTGFYVPDDYQPREADPEFRVPRVDITRKPVIYVREAYMAIDGRKNPGVVGSWRAWERRNRGAATDELESSFRLTGLIRHEHTIFSYIPPDKYFKEHPEYYSMGADGKRRGIPNDRSQICYTNPDVKEIVYRKLLEMVETDRRNSPGSHPAIYDMTQMDNSDFLCLCPECRKVIAKYNRVPGGHSEGGDAGLQLEFVNDIARRVAEKYPDVVIRVFAYVSGEVAPRPGTIKPEPNVLMWWCDLYGRSDHTLPLLEPNHFNNKQAEHLREWFRLTPNVEVWDYKLGGFDVCHEAAVADAKFFSDNGSPIIFMETEYGGNNPFYYLNCYAMLSAYANPDQDADALLRRFCRGAYGKAADEMYAATSFLQEIERSERSPTPADWFGGRHPWRSRKNYERLAELLQKAYDREDDARVRSRIVDALQSTWRALVSIYKSVPSSAKEYAAAQEAYRRYGKEYAANGFVEPSARAGLASAVDDAIDVLTLRFDDLPEELRGVEPRDLVCADYHFFNTWDRGKLDAKAYRGHAVKSSPNDDSVKGFPVICGVYDRISKENRTFRIAAEALPADGKFHWVKLGKMHNGRDSIFWFPGSWRVWETLRDHYIVADGQKVDPNWYEMWVSMAVDGPAFVPGSAEPNAVKLDRYVLRRVSP